MESLAKNAHIKTRRRVMGISCLVAVLSLTALVYRIGAVTCTPSGTNTSILALCKPASGETGWAAAINANWDLLDSLFNTGNILKVANGGTGLSAPGTSGNVLTSNGTAWVSSVPTGGSGGSDPTTTTPFFEDFLTSSDTAQYPAWSLGGGNSGFVTVNGNPVFSADASGQVALLLANLPIQWLGSQNYTLLANAATFGSSLTSRLGMSDAQLGYPIGDVSNGVYFRWSHNNGHYFAVTRKSNVETAFDTGITYSSNVFHKMKIVVTAATNAQFYIDGALVATNTANLPLATTALKFSYGISTYGGGWTGDGIKLDYVQLTQSR